MISIIIAVILLGFIHPGSKLLLESHLPLSYFCVLFVAIRLLIIAPVIYAKKETVTFKKSLGLLIIFGVIGCGLQFFEFKGIDSGLAPNTVTFLMFSYPIWLYLLNCMQDQKLGSPVASGKLVALVLGLYIIAGQSLGGVPTSEVVYPIMAGVCIALWMVIAKELRSRGFSSLSLSASYDFFSLLALLLFFHHSLTKDWPVFQEWFTVESAFSMVLYSVAIGLIPNLLFYQGSKSVATRVSGSLMSFEPVLSTLYASLIWPEVVSLSFWPGAFLIFMGNIPDAYYVKFIKGGFREKIF